MYAVIYLDNERRIKIYAEGGLQQERNITPNSEKPNRLDWYLANDEDWPDLEDCIAKFRLILCDIEGNLKEEKEV